MLPASETKIPKSRGASRIVRFQVATDASHQGWMDLAAYRYDAAGDLVEFVDAEGFSWRYRYDNHLMVEHRTAGGLSYLYRYDGKTKDASCIESWGEHVGRDDPALLVPISQRKPNGDAFAPRPKGINYVRPTYDKATHYSEVENGVGGVTRYFGDEYGRVVKRVEPNGAVMQRAFDDASGAVNAQSGGNGAATITLTDGEGMPSGFVRPDGSAVYHAVTEPFVKQSIDTATGAMISTQYNEYAQPTYVKYPDGPKDSSSCGATPRASRSAPLRWVMTSTRLRRAAHRRVGRRGAGSMTANTARGSMRVR